MKFVCVKSVYAALADRVAGLSIASRGLTLLFWSHDLLRGSLTCPEPVGTCPS